MLGLAKGKIVIADQGVALVPNPSLDYTTANLKVY